MMKKAFTLLELVVVIIILGVLATLGITQYGKMVEKGRHAEARQIIGDMRKLVYAYWWQNGTLNGMIAADLNIGPGADQIPSQCVPSHYFMYYLDLHGDRAGFLDAIRCTAGGKSPQGASNYYLEYWFDFSGPEYWRWCESVGGPCYEGSWP